MSSNRLRLNFIPILFRIKMNYADGFSFLFLLVFRFYCLLMTPFPLLSPPRAVSGGTWSKMVKEEPVIDYFDVQD